jgi:hypothetical protein
MLPAFLSSPAWPSSKPSCAALESASAPPHSPRRDSRRRRPPRSRRRDPHALQTQRHGLLYDAEVHISTAAKALPAHQQTAWDPGADPRGALDYAAVLKETQARLTHLSR